MNDFEMPVEGEGEEDESGALDEVGFEARRREMFPDL